MESYSVEVIHQLEEEFRKAAVYRPMRVGRYESGTELAYEATSVATRDTGRVRLVVVKFVGGGFAGQVYQVKMADLEAGEGRMPGLEPGRLYALKILVPPTGFSQMFRSAMYWLGFQGPFQLQVNPAAARSGALWQKFIRRAAKIRFGDESAVVDIHATLIDPGLGSCGELSEWVSGRTWRLEVDDRIDLLRRWRKGKQVEAGDLGSPEYRAKYEFMHALVDLMHEMGGHELARQYEWSTCKSQPNCLKREEAEGFPAKGLVAVDFRAGLALLPFLPQSPGDFRLISKGLRRGSLVQFDRGDIGKLERYVAANREEFADMDAMLEELKETDRVYRDSLPDMTHNHLRLLYSSRLWSTILDSAITGWRIRNLVDERSEKKLRGSKGLAVWFMLIGFLPFLGSVLRRAWGRDEWRRHYRHLLTSGNYLRRAIRARVVEKVIDWHRSGRVDSGHARKVAASFGRFLHHLPLALLPAGLHRLLTDWAYAKERLAYLAVRPVRLYFDSDLREQWLRDMVDEGQAKKLLNDADAAIILSQIPEPFIQKYLKSLAVHLCTLPVTQVVSVALAILYVALHPELPRAQAWGIGLGIVALFQVMPVSPGSLVRGLYVVYLVISERNFKDYNIAFFLSFFKYVGYLAFPIQMTYRYPALARFMAGYWATEAVHVVPVFGERGALLEHGIFNLFYNRPLTLRRRMQKRAEMRAALRPRFWHAALCCVAGSGVLGLVDFAFLRASGSLPHLNEVWPAALLVPLLCGAAVILGAGGAPLGKRIAAAAYCGLALGVLYTFTSWGLEQGAVAGAGELAVRLVWRMFAFTLFSTAGALLTELALPEPRGSASSAPASKPL